MIDVLVEKLSFQFCGEKINFCFPSPITFLLGAPPIPAVSMAFVASTVISRIRVFNGDMVPDIGCYAPYDLPLLNLTCFGSTTIYLEDVVAASPFTTLATCPPTLLPSSVV